MCRLEKDGVSQCNFYLPARSSAWAVKEDIDDFRTQWVHVDRSSFTLQVVGAHAKCVAVIGRHCSTSDIEISS